MKRTKEWEMNKWTRNEMLRQILCKQVFWEVNITYYYTLTGQHYCILFKIENRMKRQSTLCILAVRGTRLWTGYARTCSEQVLGCWNSRHTGRWKELQLEATSWIEFDPHGPTRIDLSCWLPNHKMTSQKSINPTSTWGNETSWSKNDYTNERLLSIPWD